MSPTRHRFVLLDGFRGLAALLVVLFHAQRDGSPFYKLDPLFLMVDFFFVLSGFVLLPSLPATYRDFGRQTYHFVMRRVLRLWPMVITVIAFSAGIYYLHMWWVHRTGAGFNYDVNRTTWNYTAALLLWQIWVSKSMFMVVPLWSLSAEWFANVLYVPIAAVKRGVGIAVMIAVGFAMYRYGLQTDKEWISWIGPIRGFEALGRAVAGFGFGLLARQAFDADRGRLAARVGALAAVAYLATEWVREAVYDHTPYELASSVTWLTTLVTALAGVVALRRWPTLARNGVAERVTFAVSIVAAYQLLGEYADYGYRVVYAAPPVFALLVLAAACMTVSGDSRPGRAMLTLGAWSYGIYAFHRVVMDAFNVFTAEPGHWYSTPVYMAPNRLWLHYVELKFVVVTAICIALTVATARVIERPLQSAGARMLLDRRFYRSAHSGR